MVSPLVDVGDVQVRLSEVPGLTNPTQVTPERLDQYIRDASAQLLARLGYAAPPADNTPSRDALNGLCVRLTVVMVQQSFWAGNAGMREALLKERQALLDEATALGKTSASGEGAIDFEVW